MRPVSGHNLDPQGHVLRRMPGSRPSLHAGSRNDLPGAPTLAATPLPPPPADAPRRAPRDPAPSRISYRMHRLWLTPLFRAILRVGIPAFVVIFALGALLSDESRRDGVVQGWNDARAALEARPEFRVSEMAVQGASPTVKAALTAMGPQEFPVSSFQLDLDRLRTEFEALDAVATAELRVSSGGVLEVRIRERVPAIVWRTPDGFDLLDAAGYRVARLRQRSARADLPLIAGAGADAAVPEAMALIAASAPLGERVQGLVRMGARRWDVVLSTGQRILLPETGAIAALERVLAQNQSQDLLQRDVALVDMRDPSRPTLRLNPEAVVELRRIRALERGVSN